MEDAVKVIASKTSYMLGFYLESIIEVRKKGNSTDQSNRRICNNFVTLSCIKKVKMHEYSKATGQGKVLALVSQRFFIFLVPHIRVWRALSSRDFFTLRESSLLVWEQFKGRSCPHLPLQPFCCSLLSTRIFLVAGSFAFQSSYVAQNVALFRKVTFARIGAAHWRERSESVNGIVGRPSGRQRASNNDRLTMIKGGFEEESEQTRPWVRPQIKPGTFSLQARSRTTLQWGKNSKTLGLVAQTGE